MIEKLQSYIRENRLLKAGDRLAVAVSGGADSVALLRGLLELRQQLGIVLSVVHFLHGIRGAEGDADLRFVTELAVNYGLQLRAWSADVPGYARKTRTNLEAAARELRYQWFAQLVQEGRADKIATGHTLDDQAETVLMRLFRGTGTRGLAGIFPRHEGKHLIRPFLQVRRHEVETYLHELGQPWREDSTNSDLRLARNRVRHQLLPLLERDFNPAIRYTLADLAEVARSDAEYWDSAVGALAGQVLRSGKDGGTRRASQGGKKTVLLDLASLRNLPPALQRRMLQEAASRLAVDLEFKHIQQLTDAFLRREDFTGQVVLPRGLTAVRISHELEISQAPQTNLRAYSYPLKIPGEVIIPELGLILRARVVESGSINHYGPHMLLDRDRLGAGLKVRNWRAGDRFFPGGTHAPRKLKELLQSGRLRRPLGMAERKTWPVVEREGELVWVRGLAVPEAFAVRDGEPVLIDLIPSC